MKIHSANSILFVHDWLTGMRGGEKCLEILCEWQPTAPLFTLFHRFGSVSRTIENRPILTSWFQRLPHIQSYYRYLLPVMPLALPSRLPKAKLMISLSHCIAKSVQPPPGAAHLCYCFTPMRYAWQMRDAYFSAPKRNRLKARAIDLLLDQLSAWDRQTAAQVTEFIAISKTIRNRILTCYQRNSTVIYPPVNTHFFTPSFQKRENFYLVVSAFAPYKKIDLAIRACQQLKRQLIIIGTGQAKRQLQAIANSEYIHFLGHQSDESIRDYLRRCQALLFPGEEDFGIVPVEANACGTPVIALNRGGVQETVIGLANNDNATGIFFDEADVDHLIGAMLQFEKSGKNISSESCRKRALQFSSNQFAQKFIDHVERHYGISREEWIPQRRAG